MFVKNIKITETAMSRRAPTLVSKIIQRLMEAIMIKEAELARQTGLPQTTINRLLLSETTDPRANTLKPIAKFFGVTIGQLLGEEPINPSRIRGSFNAINRSAWSHIPIILWEEVLGWVFKKDTYNIHSHDKWITTERPISDNSFALLSKSFIEPRFRKNSVLIIDPLAEREDGKFVVISLDNINVTVRQVNLDNAETYLKHFDTTLSTIRLDSKFHKILGTIVEARIEA